MSGCQSWEADCGIMAQRAEGFQCHVAARYGPLVVLLEHQCADEADYRGVIRKDADDIGPALDLLVDPFQRVGGRDLLPVLLRERHVGKHVLA